MENINSKIYQAAIYLRLSREDGDVAEGSKLVSNSITNQEVRKYFVLTQKARKINRISSG